MVQDLYRLVMGGMIVSCGRGHVPDIWFDFPWLVYLWDECIPPIPMKDVLEIISVSKLRLLKNSRIRAMK